MAFGKFRFGNGNKFHNKKVVYDGIQFDSVLEKDRYVFLKLMERKGIVTDIERQVEYVIIPAQFVEEERVGKNGQKLKPLRRCVERETKYKADFVYTYDGRTIIEDTKSEITRKGKDYVMKRKLMRLQGNPIVEVFKSNEVIK